MASTFEISDNIINKVCLISIVDIISTTSIPINEFIIYRNGIRDNYRQVVFTRISENRGHVSLPRNIDVHLIPSSIWMFRQQINALVKKCKRNDEKIVFHMHHQKSALYFFQATLFTGLWKSTVFTIHSYYSDRDWKYKLSSCLCAILANYINCVSKAAYEDYPKWVRVIKGRRMEALLNGIDCKRIERALEGEGKHCEVMDMRRLVCVDRIIPIKNQKFIVQLLKYLPDTRLTLVGMEDDNYAIRQFAKNEGVDDRIEFTGLLPREDVYRTINKCGLYVTASIVEGLHLSVLEAMRIGAIPLISDIPPHREIAANSEKLFKPLPLKEDVWVKTIQTYQNTEMLALKDLSDKLAQITEKNFSLDKMHKQYDAVYEQIVR